jgi:acyl carrier protein
MASVTAPQIIDVIRKSNVVKEPAALENDKPLTDQGVDSLDFSSLLFNIEEEFEIEIPDEDIDGLQTISEIVIYINTKA